MEFPQPPTHESPRHPLPSSERNSIAPEGRLGPAPPPPVGKVMAWPTRAAPPPAPLPRPAGGLARRDVLKAAVAGAAGFWVAGRGVWADEAKAATDPADKVRLGIIGVTGRASGNL